MQEIASFSIYNASAGSGKTFTLVKAYLNTLLLSNKPDYFKTILAITFTNKAVGEMKERIMSNLKDFSEENIVETPSDMAKAVSLETGLPILELHKRAQKAIQYILHNYGSFDVETIDRFNHRLIRTFAKDLKLSTNFEVELDVNALLNEAVDRVINLAGKDPILTSVILDFTFEKADEDKSWDITFDLNEISNLLKNENDLVHVEKIRNKSISNFLEFKKTVLHKIKINTTTIISVAKKFIAEMDRNGLSFSDFSGNYVESYINKLLNKNFKMEFTAIWQISFGEKPLYRAKEKKEIITAFENCTRQLTLLFLESKDLVLHYQFLKMIQSNINSLSLLNAIYKEFKALQEEKNIVPISEFNSRIYNEIKEQPAPFIYERLGDRYRHFFIDEFQDTSLLQWQNLVPLIDNSLSQQDLEGETGSLLIVGDAKQSIYRWRGGFPEQFIGLNNEENPFANQSKNKQTLEKNYRSFNQIITFNNDFFWFSSNALQSENHKELYKKGNTQEVNIKNGGYVSIQFIEAENQSEAMEVYPEKVLQIVQMQLSKGFEAKDICILTRKKIQGVAIGAKLSENGISILSSEVLLLNNSTHIQFLIGLLALINNFEDKASKAKVLYLLHSHLGTNEEKHTFINTFFQVSQKEFTEKLKKYAILFDFNLLSSMPLYDICEYISASFHLTDNAAAYIQCFLDVVLEFSAQKQVTISSFLENWEQKKKSISIDVSEGINAVKIMTIHKAKGLEFPVVIYPFADDDLFDVKRKKIWFPLQKEEFNGFSEILIPLNKNIENYGEVGKALFNEQKEQAQLDTMNVVYVALTRAVEQLFVLSINSKKTKKENIASLFYSYINQSGDYNEKKTEFTFGNPNKNDSPPKKKEAIEKILLNHLISSDKSKNNIFIATNSSLLWDTTQEKAIEKGNLMHLILSEIKSYADVDSAIKKYTDNGILNIPQSIQINETIKQLINHPNLKAYFKPECKAELERDIFTKEGAILRPDRLNFLDTNKVSLIDYKTGAFSIKHKTQLAHYESALQEMGFIVEEKLLVYMNENIDVVNV
ncbi:MAG: DNA helicase UvrD [Bacteroidetes bacterium HGW-Bacteroidetes-2]|nr:MAG: DNA helicase UvrD [Bacteroidetes bacterium HGW-Bacteroidetes-2]